MSAPWFNPTLAFLPGTLLGVAAGLWGSAAGLLAPKGKAKRVVIGLAWAFLVGSGLLLAAGLAARFTGQPYPVWYGLTLPGALGVTVIGANLPNVLKVYRAAEERRMRAEDVRL